MTTLQKLDQLALGFMERWGLVCLRISLAIIFIWFGILKPLGLSSVEAMVIATISWLPLLTDQQWVSVIGWWEVLIGVGFLFKKTIRMALVLLALQMGGTFMPLVMLPEVVYQPGYIPFGLTMEGQYIIKNLLVISAAMVVGATTLKPQE